MSEVVNTQMSVKRYDVEAYSWFGTAHWNLVESEVGDFVYASDYDELRERHNTQMSVKRYDVEAESWFGTAHWNLVESEVGDFVYASDYDELRERHNALVEE